MLIRYVGVPAQRHPHTINPFSFVQLYPVVARHYAFFHCIGHSWTVMFYLSMVILSGLLK